jgi:5-methylcytosine-specific restriction endonuclease McrA
MARTWHGSKWIRPEKRAAIYVRDGHRCVYCGRHADELDEPLTLDHVRAVELGGTNEAANLVTACRRCNSAKQDLPLRGFIARLRTWGVEDDVARRVRNATARVLRAA